MIKEKFEHYKNEVSKGFIHKRVKNSRVIVLNRFDDSLFNLRRIMVIIATKQEQEINGSLQFF